jgi:hypothetical protein
MKARIASLSFALLLGGAAMSASAAASPAMAASWPYGCPSGATCAYEGVNFVGTPGEVMGDNANDKQYATWANVESILNNGTECEDWVYYDENWDGTDVVGYPLGTGNTTLAGTWAWHHLWSNYWCNEKHG